ncbi:hypothetical protein GCM10027047_02910 [Rhodococcus aerolatus]
MSDVRPASRHEAAVLRAWADVAVLAPVPVPGTAVPLPDAPTGPGRVHLACLPATVVQGWLRAALPETDAAPWPGRVGRACFDLDDAGAPVPGSLLVTPLLDLAHALYAKSAGMALDAGLTDEALAQVAALDETLQRVFARLAPGADVLGTCAALGRAAPRVQHREAGGTTGTPVDLLAPAGPLPGEALLPAELYDAVDHGVAPALAHLLAGRPGSRPVRRTDVGTVAGLATLLSPDDLPRAAAPGPADPLPVQVAVTALLRERAPLTTVAGRDPGRVTAVLDGLVAGLALERADALVAGGTPVAALTDDGVVDGVAGRELVLVGPAPDDVPRLVDVLAELRAGGGLDRAAVTPGEWGRRRHTFALAEQAVADALRVRADATGARWELADREADAAAADTALGRAREEVGAAQQAVLAAELAESETGEALAAARTARDEATTGEPPRRALGRRRAWAARGVETEAALADAHRARDEARTAHTAARVTVQQRVAVRVAAEQAAREAREAAAAVRGRTRADDPTVVDEGWWARDDAVRRAGTAWVDDELQELRVALAAAAQRLTDVAVRVLLPRLRPRLLGDVPRDAGFWQALGLVHPVLQVDPDDAVRLLAGAPVDTVGWLALTGAETVDAATAAALLRRVRHAVVVGAPEAAAPTPLLPATLVAHLTTRHGLAAGWAGTGLLRLAQSTATTGTDVDGTWQGIPVDPDQDPEDDE